MFLTLSSGSDVSCPFANNEEQYKIRNSKVQYYFSDPGRRFSAGRFFMVLNLLLYGHSWILGCFFPLTSEQGEEMINSYRQKVYLIAMK